MAPPITVYIIVYSTIELHASGLIITSSQMGFILYHNEQQMRTRDAMAIFLLFTQQLKGFEICYVCYAHIYVGIIDLRP